MSPTPRTSVPIAEIQIVDRQRSDLGNIDDLAASLKEHGLIQPIVVNQELRLIAGGRRLTAAKSLGWSHIDVVFRETMNESELQALELEENVRRKAISWQEHTLAIARIHGFRANQAVKSGETWGHRETADLFGLSKTSVTNALAVARAIRAGNEKVAQAETPSDAIRILLQEKEDEAIRLLSSRQLPTPTKHNRDAPTTPISSPTSDDPTANLSRLDKLAHDVNRKIYLNSWFGNASCLQWMPDVLVPGSVDAIITDPPYAIDVSYMDQAAGGLNDIDRIEDTHNPEENVKLLRAFVPLAHLCLRPSGFLAMWCDYMLWDFLYDLGTEAGFSVQRWPIVWHKTSPCVNMAASKNFTKDTEIAIVMRKDRAVLAKPAITSVITAPNSEKLSSHPFAKPPAVWDFLARHLCIQNSLIVDPFMGVASSLIPFLALGHRVMGCEIDPLHFAHGIENLKQQYLKLRPDAIFD